MAMPVDPRRNAREVEIIGEKNDTLLDHQIGVSTTFNKWWSCGKDQLQKQLGGKKAFFPSAFGR